ncbi:heavy-metal-associated domain-containing protein [Nodosilinea sp. PGN35]|uniref:heavy-metal-associated domain-containing protein n=1 Tax=Nodosilinea sp. PGN35 TaxID=3020489 RepID=UPI0023B2ED91|nr:heavy-metal-associated domain-containing protein [Nodosilinea sp. TSF1-S3]MDF0365655.1 heavy-metal-associated domain-containing protein [Nodosilinea sp. TSF1-S3]
MSLTFQVSTLGDQKSAQELKELILTSEPDAKVDVNPQAKTVTIDAKASEETFKELIVAAGHTIQPMNPAQEPV